MLHLPSTAVSSEAAFASQAPLLAAQLIKTYKNADKGIYLNNLVAFEVEAGQFVEARKTLAELRAMHLRGSAPAVYVRWQIYADAAAKEASGMAFDKAYQSSFRDFLAEMDNKSAYQDIHYFAIHLPDLERGLKDDFAGQKGKSDISVDDAANLMFDYFALKGARKYAPLYQALIDEDDARRYIVDKDVFVTTPDGAKVKAVVFRPKSTEKQPTLLEYTIYVDAFGLSEARLGAVHGYASVIAYTRGKAGSPGPIAPYEHDGADADAVINWIADQPWSDGRVGMYGGSYNGFTQWAAAKHKPKALKALMPSVAARPGLDVPKEGNVFLSFVYSWVPYRSNNSTLDNDTYNDQDRWDRLERNWYVTGKP